MKYLLPILAATILASCSRVYPSFDSFERDVYDVPAKTQFTQKVAVGDSLNQEQITTLLNMLYEDALNKEYKHHKEPTHVFIYAYRSQADSKRDGTSWVGMVSRIDGQEKGVELKQ